MQVRTQSGHKRWSKIVEQSGQSRVQNESKKSNHKHALRIHLDQIKLLTMIVQRKDEGIAEDSDTISRGSQRDGESRNRGRTRTRSDHRPRTRRPGRELWRCWTKPALVKQWFRPPPWFVIDVRMELQPEDEFHSVFNGPAGKSFENAGVFLEFEPLRRPVTTDALRPGRTPGRRRRSPA